MPDILSELKGVLSSGGLLTGTDLAERRFAGGILPIALVRPRSTAEVAAVMGICAAHKQPLVPMGGMTGLVQGTKLKPGELALSLELLNQIESIDVQSRTMTVQAGVPLQQVQEKAEAAGMLFPLDLGARGSATIGGNLATNAGGNRVIRYGMMREQVLGLEAVLADGTVVSSMSKIIKNNTGYDIKQLFIGAEGTLGIVTRVVLRLRPLPVSQNLAFVAVSEFDQVTHFLNHIDTAMGGTLSAFEVLWQDFYALVTNPPAKGKPPLPAGHGYYILVEAMGGDISADQERFVDALGVALEAGMIDDAVIGQSQAERDAMWALRDDVGQVNQHAPIFTFDISVSLDQMASYVDDLKAALALTWPDHTCMIFGHLGDGNLHIIVGSVAGSEGDDVPAIKKQVEKLVYGGLPARGGSISAEHGIGLQKKPYLSMSRSTAEIKVMQLVKQALDPHNLLNPGKILG